MSTSTAVRRRFEARHEPTEAMPGRWVLWDGLVGRTLSRLVICDGEAEAVHLAARLNAAWRETVSRRLDVAAESDAMGAYLDGIGGERGEGDADG